MRHVVLGTAGHIDHGKSTLVHRLTGIDPDRLPDEKKTGMTIDLGFAPLTLGDGRKIGIVDVPGHERFIKNMVAGATGVDLVMLVIAADDGVMPQTREHLDIMTLLGMKTGLVALNKIDVVEVAERRGELEALFQKGEIEPVLISAAGGEGVEALVTDLAGRLKEMDAAEEELEEAKAEEDAPPPVVRPAGRPGSVTIDRQDGAYHVAGERAVAFAEMMPLENEEGRAELWRRFGLWGVVGALKRAGAKRGDRIVLGSVELELEA